MHCDFKPGNDMLVSERPADIDSLQSAQSVSLDRMKVTQSAIGADVASGRPAASGGHLC